MVFHKSVSLLTKLRSRAVQQPGLRNSVRWLQVQTSSDVDLHSQLKELIPEQQERLKKLKSEHGKVQLGNITVDMVLGGMRGMTGLLWETSLLDPEEGIRFRGLSIPECQKLLPAAKPDGEPLPEGLLWLLLTGKVPTKEQVDALSKELRNRATVPDHVYKTIDALPVTAHPMTQFATGVMALQVQSEFQKAYEKGIHKSKYWEPTYEDSLSLIAQLPIVASYVYRSDHEGEMLVPILVASALSDPYLSFAAALNGLAGPLHGLANQGLSCGWLIYSLGVCEVDFKHANHVKLTWLLCATPKTSCRYGLECRNVVAGVWLQYHRMMYLSEFCTQYRRLTWHFRLLGLSCFGHKTLVGSLAMDQICGRRVWGKCQQRTSERLRLEDIE
ncbi:UNVERIFIED_CONTAM: Citrate synthase, mitochondrial [Sesamum radiatum]|uniref:Citrate synthase, mitochondrial n=1 Tax=Sesamum radiatum TaxID=300843 RepID=A0AAW2KQ58_SESRA